MLTLLALAAASDAPRLAHVDPDDASDDLPTVDDVDGAPIINGEPAAADDYPQAGGMLMDMDLDLGSSGSGNYRMFVCSSTLIAPDVVMLAAHCLDESSFTYGQGTMDINEVRWTRQADLTDLDGTRRRPDWPEDSIAALDWVMHREFDVVQLSVGIAENSDIALLFLEEPVLDTPFAYVPTEDETDQLVEGDTVTVVGWGQQEATDAWEMPDAGTYGLKYMGESPVGDIGEFEFQVGPDEDDVRKCHGDSGGPTFSRIDTDTAEDLRVIGVTSHAYDGTDCERRGGVDTRVMAYRDWIDSQMVERCEDGTRAWCDTFGLPEAPLPAPAEEEDEEELAACGCASGAPSTGLWALGLGALAVRRRR